MSDSKGAELWDLSLEELLEIEINTVDKSPHNLLELPATAWVVTQSEIDAGGYTNLIDLLAYVPSVEYGYPHSWLQGGLRGFSDNWSKAKLLVDGEEANLLFTGEAFIGHQFDLGGIERVEVIPGPASVQYGADAFSGIINLVTNQKLGGRFETGYETGERGFGAWRMSGSYGAEKDGLYVFGSFHYYDGEDADFTDWVRTDAFSEPNQALHVELLESGQYPYRDINRAYSIKTGLEYQLDQLQTVSLSYQRYFDRDGGGQESPEISFRDFYTRRDQQVYLASYRRRSADDSLNWELTFRYRLEDELNRFNFREPVDGELSPLYRYDIEGSEELGLDLSLDYTPEWGVGNLRLGLGVEEQDMVAPIFELDSLESLTPFLDRKNEHAYLQYSLPMGSGSEFFLGGRRDWNNLYESPNLLRSGIRLTPLENLTVKLLFGQAYRAPTLFELELNDELGPSYMDTKEVSIAYRVEEHLFFQLSLFESEASDLIVNRQVTDDDQATDLFVAFNEGTKDVRGLELEGRYFFDRGQLSLWASVLGGDSEFDLAESKFGMRYIYRITDRLEAGLSGKYAAAMSTRFVDGDFMMQELEVPSLLNFDLKLSCRIGSQDGRRLWVRVRNLLDEENYYPNVRGLDPKQFKAMGRSWGVGYQVDW
ncbi:TonB-dependent receptor plug domain-containing protein [Pelagicoccus enzymogenes]|uniref:TonB-dependent receptor plug domain-containing protein n=1 Tax=Pelagicoccus enzymogenes TaxID=2773457 RepID=UPI0017853D16|nr:TonB-dependent receptor [Pelagicoccus enzymogenes]